MRTDSSVHVYAFPKERGKEDANIKKVIESQVTNIRLTPIVGIANQNRRTMASYAERMSTEMECLHSSTAVIEANGHAKLVKLQVAIPLSIIRLIALVSQRCNGILSVHRERCERDSVRQTVKK